MLLISLKEKRFKETVLCHSGISLMLSSTELKQTKLILDFSLGWYLLFDGSNQGKWHTKGELLLFRDVDEKDEVRERVLHMS